MNNRCELHAVYRVRISDDDVRDVCEKHWRELQEAQHFEGLHILGVSRITSSRSMCEAVKVV